jgi:hypothetical protein
MANKKTKIIRRERREMTDEKRVARALVKCSDVFKEEHLNFTEGLAVAESIIVNAFGNAADDAQSTEELQGLVDIAEEYLTTLTHNTAEAIK